MMSSKLATLYTARTLAVACLYDTLRDLNFHISSFPDWCREVGKVDETDVDGFAIQLRILTVEAIEDLRRLAREGVGKDIM